MYNGLTDEEVLQSREKYGANELSTKWKQTHKHREQACDCQGQGDGEGWTGSLGLVDTNYYISNG